MLFSKDSHILIGFALPNLEDIAKSYYRKHQYTEAAEAYGKLIKQFPKRDDLFISCGNCFDALNDKKSAIEFYQKALHINKKSTVALANLSTAYYEIGDYNLSEKYCLKALKIDALNAPVLINLGNIKYQKSDYCQALNFYQKAALAKPDYYIAEINIANTFYDLKNYAEAIQYAQKSLALDSKNHMTHTILGNAYLELEDYDQAVASFLHALQLDSNDPWIYNSLSQAYQKKSLWIDALSCGWQAIEKSHNDDAHHINFGYMLYEAALEKQDSLAHDYAQKWLEQYSDNQIVVHMGNAILDDKQIKVANDKYVKDIFDIFAPDFESVLQGLEYQAPTLISGFLSEIYAENSKPKLRILDAGCGTGLCGNFLKKYASWRGLTGVDLSPKMLEIAASKKLYNKLIPAELVSFLEGQNQAYDLIVSADVFTYLGDLDNLFKGLFQALKNKGRVVFSVSENDQNSEDFFLHVSGRFLHNKNYIENLLQKNGFKIERSLRERLRNEGENEVVGYIFSAQKSA